MRLLSYFHHRHLDFRRPEIESLARLFGCTGDDTVHWDPPFGGHVESPFWYLNVPSEEKAAAIAGRAVLLKGFYEIWGEGETWEEMAAAVQSFSIDRMTPYLGEGTSFKVDVVTWGMGFTHEEILELIDKLCSFIPFKGKVNLKNPQHTFTLFRANANDIGHPGFPSHLAPDRWYFGRHVASSDRSFIPRYDLKKRPYIGCTSMDPELAHIMCNQAKVPSGGLVYDPFVGTGGILVAAAHYGGITLGMDIDIRVVRPKGTSKKGKPPSNVYSNFKQYKLSDPVGLLRADTHRPPFRADLSEWLDAIVCDPPYGVRESARKSGPKDIKIIDRETYIPSTQPYFLGEVIHDLVEFAARNLKIGARLVLRRLRAEAQAHCPTANNIPAVMHLHPAGGRLVFWMPSAPGLYEETELPSHPVMPIMYNVEQYLSSRYSRRMITMEKQHKLDDVAASAWSTHRGDAVMKINEIPRRVFEVMEKDEDGNPRNPEWLRGKQPFRGKHI